MDYSQQGGSGGGLGPICSTQMGKELWEAVEGEVDLEEVRGGIYKGGPMETDIDEGLRGIQINWSDIIVTSAEGEVNCGKVVLSATRLEGKFGEGFGEMNADEPVIFPAPITHHRHSHKTTCFSYPRPHPSLKYPMSKLPMLKSLCENQEIRPMECASRRHRSKV